MISEKRLIDILPEGSFNGFLKSMPETAPWAEDTPDLDSLDALYLYQHSGEKYVAPLMNMFLTDGKLTQQGITNCSKMAASLWYPKWTRLWNVMTAEYNPLENYNMHEEEDTAPTGTETTELEFTGTETDTNTKSGSETNTLAKTGTETETDTKSGTQTNTRTESGTETDTLSHTGTDSVRTQGTAANNKESNAVYGFNSSTAVPASETTVNTDSTVTTTPGVTDTNNKTFTNRQTQDVESFTNREDTKELSFENRADTETLTFTNRQDQNQKTFLNRKNTETKSFEDRNTHRDLYRSGNIGTVTAQDMYLQELEVAKYNFWLQVFEDLDSTICLDCY